MIYATPQEFERLVGRSEYLLAADRDGDGEADVESVELALQGASDTMNGYLARWLPQIRALPPESPTRRSLRSTAIRIAHYDLTAQTGNEETRKRYEDAIKWLERVSKGTVSLGLEPAKEERAGRAELSARPRIMSRRDLEGVL